MTRLIFHVPCFLFPLFCTFAAEAEVFAKVYVHKHREISIEADSPQWQKLSPEEQTRYRAESEYLGREGVPENVEDVFVLESSGESIRFCLQHVGHLLHMCDVAGKASGKNKAFVYEDESGCRLNIATGSEKVVIEDKGGTCASLCGARADLSLVEFSADDVVRDERNQREIRANCELPE